MTSPPPIFLVSCATHLHFAIYIYIYRALPLQPFLSRSLASYYERHGQKRSSCSLTFLACRFTALAMLLWPGCSSLFAALISAIFLTSPTLYLCAVMR
ncbi:hypothetical protein CPB85DRAFT_189296 [Mucidula mucida]|nr:hypothetical protein CPB85DRAFT_189296 [Mucidula mucida]